MALIVTVLEPQNANRTFPKFLRMNIGDVRAYVISSHGSGIMGWVNIFFRLCQMSTGVACVCGTNKHGLEVGDTKKNFPWSYAAITVGSGVSGAEGQGWDLLQVLK